MTATTSEQAPNALAGEVADADVRPATTFLLRAFVVFTAFGAAVLYGWPADTERMFAWTISPPITAAFLGAGYLAGFVLSVLTLQARTWAEARLAIVTVLVFVALTLAATLAHLDRFHLGAGATMAEIAAWIWLGVYVIVPIAIAIVLGRQRASRPAPFAQLPMPTWLAVTLTVEAVVLLGVGAALYSTPAAAATIWPWPLTPLTARIVAAWLIAFGVAALLARRERDLARLKIASIPYAVFGAAQLATVARFPDALAWSEPRSVAYVTSCSAIALTGVCGRWAASTGGAKMERRQ